MVGAPSFTAFRRTEKVEIKKAEIEIEIESPTFNSVTAGRGGLTGG